MIVKFFPISILVVVYVLSPFMSAFAQEGLSWLKPLNTERSINNSQYQCLYLGGITSLDNGSVFNINNHSGLNDGIGVHSFIVRDINNDGYCDIFLPFFSNEKEKVPFKIFIYDSSIGKHVDKSNMISNNTGQYFNRKTLSGDLNSDGILDFVMVSHPELPEMDTSYFDIVLSNNFGWEQKTLSTPVRYGSEDPENPFGKGYYHGLGLGDLNNDGNLDIVLSNWHNQRGAITYINDGQGNFEQFYSIDNPELAELNESFTNDRMSFTNELFDIDNDGCLDNIMGGNGSVPYAFIITFGNCDGKFGDRYNKIFYSDSTLNTFNNKNENAVITQVELKFADFNSDGLVDILGIATDYNNWRLTYFEQQKSDSTELFIDKSSQFNKSLIDQGFYEDYASSNAYIPYIELLDVNNDGLDDIVPKFNIWDNSWRWILIANGFGDYKYGKYPSLETTWKQVSYDNETVIIDIRLLQLADDEDRFQFQNSEQQVGYRNQIKAWNIYYSDRNWAPHERESVQKVTINHSDDLKSNITNKFNYNLRLSLDVSPIYSDSVFLRYSHLDEFGVESPLSTLEAKFIYTKLKAPNLVQPSNTQTNVETDPYFRWLKGNNTDTYHIQLSENNFNTIKYEYFDVDSTYFKLQTPLSANTTYFWRVKAQNESNYRDSDWSEVFSFKTGVLTSIDEQLPTETSLQQNYPNPFNPSTQIRFSLAESSLTTLEVYSIDGTRVASLVNQVLNAGWHTATFNATNLPTGLYLYRLNTESQQITKKMLLVK